MLWQGLARGIKASDDMAVHGVHAKARHAMAWRTQWYGAEWGGMAQHDIGMAWRDMPRDGMAW